MNNTKEQNLLYKEIIADWMFLEKYLIKDCETFFVPKIREFSDAMQEHLIKYVAKQYGESIVNGENPLSTCSPQEAIMLCSMNIQKYKARKGNNQRPYNDGRDCLKRAHYASLRAKYRTRVTIDDIEEAMHAIDDWYKI